MTNITNIQISLLGLSDRFALHWKDADTSEQFHVWFANFADMKSRSLTRADTLYKNPPKGVEYGDKGHFRTRHLNPTAKTHEKAVSEARKLALLNHSHDKAIAEEAKEAECDHRGVVRRIRDAAPDLLAALERSHQYVWLQLRDARDDKRLSPGTIKTAERDLEMVEAAIARAKGEAR